MLRFGMKGKLALRYIRPFEIGNMIEPIAYKLVLLPYLAKIYDVLQVSLLRVAKVDPTLVLHQVSLEIKEDLTLEVK